MQDEEWSLDQLGQMFATAFCSQAHLLNDSVDTLIWLTLLAAAIAILNMYLSSRTRPLSGYSVRGT